MKVVEEKKEGSRSSPRGYCGSSAELELERQAECQLTRSGSRGLAGDGAGGENISAGVAGVDVVNGVDRIKAELHRKVLPDIEALLKRHIRVEEGRPKVTVAANVADVVETWIGERAAKRLRRVEGPSGSGNEA